MQYNLVVKLIIGLALLGMVTIGLNCGPKDKLVGTWSLTAGGCGQAQLVLSKDGTGTISSLTGTDTFRWRVEGHQLILSDHGATNPSEKEGRIDYQLRENQLILTGDGQAFVFTRVGP